MARPYDRPAAIAALVNGVVVMLLPLAFAGAVNLFANDYSNGGTRVVGSLPAGEHYARMAQGVVAYVMALSPFAMAAAIRTFVHARRWFETGATGWRGVLEAGACGFLAALLILLPGILPRLLKQPSLAAVYVLFYAGLTLVPGLAVGLLLWATGTLTVKLFGRTPTSLGADGDPSR